MSPGPTMPTEGASKKFIKPINLSRQDRIVPRSLMTRERCVIQDKFKDVVTAAVNAEHRGFLIQLVLALKDGITEKMVKTLTLVINREAAIAGGPESTHIVEFLNGETPKPEGLTTGDFCDRVLQYLIWKEENDGIMMQVFRDTYEFERGRKKGILNEVLVEAAKLLAEQEELPPEQPVLDPQQKIKSIILENLREYSEAEQHKPRGHQNHDRTVLARVERRF